MQKLFIIIVNYRTPELVVDCLRTLEKELVIASNFYVKIIDNHSNDHSVSFIQSAIVENGWSQWIDVEESSKNGGFSFGNNIAIRKILNNSQLPDYIYLLNPDVQVHPGCIQTLIDFMDVNSNVGIAGGAIVDMDGTPQNVARRFPSALSELENAARLGVLSKFLDKNKISMNIEHNSHSCDWVSGASMIIRRQVIESIGLMDEEYFLYFEELDYCKRAKDAGFEVWYVPASVISHIEGASTNVNKKQRRGGYWYNSRRRYIVKTHGILALLRWDFLWALGRLSFNFRKLFRLGKDFSSANLDPSWFAWDLLAGDFKSFMSRQFWKINKSVENER